MVRIPNTTQKVPEPPAAVPQPSAAEVRAELQRILGSRCFEQAARSSKFLQFVVEQTLAGQGERLKGYTIAIEVFGRPPDFDAQSDPLVRVEAGRLRRRLTEYYAEKGRENAVRIDLPRGAYSVTAAYQPSRAEVLLGPMPGELGDSGDLAEPREPTRNRRLWRRVRTVLIAAVLLTGLSVVLVQQLMPRAGSAVTQATTPRSVGKPSIAVLPFEDLGGGVATRDLALALREELLLLLDDPEVFVVAVHSDAAGGTALEASAATYVLSGSARTTADQARITARLLEASSRRQIWSRAYDEPLAALRDPGAQRALAQRMATVAEPYGPIFQAEVERVRAMPVGDLPVYDCVLKYYEFRRVLDRERHADALACFERATVREPGSAEAWAVLALLSVDEYAHGYMEPGAAPPLDDAREAARRAMDIDGNNLHANLALAASQYFAGDDFRNVAERVLRAWPDNAEAQALLGAFYVLAGETAPGGALVDAALAATARAPSGYHTTRALAALRSGRYDDALTAVLRVDSPDWPLGQFVTAAIAAWAGRDDLAARARARVLALDPTIETSQAEVLRRWRVEPELAALLEQGFARAGR